MDQETWRTIKEFPNYSISNLGRVHNNRVNRPMAISRTGYGHVKIGLRDSITGERFTRSVALLVAEAFVESPDILCDSVVLLDGDQTNVAADNLVWRPSWYAWKYVRQFKTPKSVYYENLAVRNITARRNYPSIVDAAMTEGLLFEEIWRSTYMAKPLYPYGFVFKVIERV